MNAAKPYATLCFALFVVAGCAQTAVTFVVLDAPTKAVQQINIWGSDSPLSWERAVRLKADSTGHSVMLEFAADVQQLEFKLASNKKGKKPRWESRNNRVLALPKPGEYRVTIHWKGAQHMELTSRQR